MYPTIGRVANKYLRSFFKRFNYSPNKFCALLRRPPACLYCIVLLFEVINGESVIYLTLYKHAWLTITTTATENRIINTTFFWFGSAITLLIFTIFFSRFCKRSLAFCLHCKSNGDKTINR